MNPSAIDADGLMHATPVRRPFDRPGWTFEHALDGLRALARRGGDHVDLISQNGRPIAVQFPEVVRALKRLDGKWVLDGELVVSDEHGRPSPELVRRRGAMKVNGSIVAASRAMPATIFVFDLLLQDGDDLRRRPLSERRARLAELVETQPRMQLVGSLPEHGIALFEQTCAMDFEGIVGKDLTSMYRAGTHPTWIKVKNPRYSRADAAALRNAHAGE